MQNPVSVTEPCPRLLNNFGLHIVPVVYMLLPMLKNLQVPLWKYLKLFPVCEQGFQKTECGTTSPFIESWRRVMQSRCMFWELWQVTSGLETRKQQHSAIGDWQQSRLLFALRKVYLYILKVSNHRFWQIISQDFSFSLSSVEESVTNYWHHLVRTLQIGIMAIQIKPHINLSGIFFSHILLRLSQILASWLDVDGSMLPLVQDHLQSGPSIAGTSVMCFTTIHFIANEQN